MAQGRKVTTEQTEKLLEGLRYGMTRRAASGYAGMHYTTLYAMMAKDSTLPTLIEKAEAEAEAAHTRIVAEAGPKNWQASAWWLERRHPDNYGRRDRVDVTFDLRKFAEERGLDPDEVMAEADAILSARNARG